jgi:mannosyltransferase
MAALDLPGLWRGIIEQESFNGLYYQFLHLWIGGGNGEPWLRLPSVAFAVAAASVLFLLNRRLLGSGVAIIAAVLLATNVLFVNYAQEARGYSLALLGVVSSTYLFVGAVEHPSTWRWLSYAVTGAIAVYAHAFAAFVIAAHVMLLLVRGRTRYLRHVLTGYGVLATLSAPLLILMLATDPLRRPFARSASGDTLMWVLRNFVGADSFATGIPLGPRRSIVLLAGYLIAIVAAVALTFRDRRRVPDDRRGGSFPYVLLLVLWVVLPFGGSFLFSLARPIIHPQYVFVSLPAFVTLAAIGVGHISNRLIQVIALSALVWLAFPTLHAYFQTDCKRPTENWRAAVNLVLSWQQPGDGVLLVSPYGRVPFEYYLASSDAPEIQPIYPSAPWGAYPLVSDAPEPPRVAVGPLSRGVGRVWAVLTWGGVSRVESEGHVLSEVLSQRYDQLAETRLCRYMRVRLYALQS